MNTLVIGLDGVCLSVLQPLINDGTVPTIERIHADSAVGPLTSQLPPWTPSAWPSLYTGVNPGKHGVYSFLNFDGYDWDVVNRSHVKAHAVWELLSINDISSVILNVPATHPPRAFDGVLVPGYMGPEEPPCHPAGTFEELRSELGDYSLYGETLRSNASNQKLADELARLAQMRGEAFSYLVDEHNPEFGFVQFQATDTVYHQLPKDEGGIRQVYGAVDDAVDKILGVCDPNLVLVVSDHGLGPMDGYEFRVNEFLRANDYVSTTASGDGMPSWKSLAYEDAEVKTGSERLVSVAATALSHAAQVGFTSQRLAAVLKRIGLADWALETIPVDIVRAGTEQIDFAASTAYMRVRTEMGVRLNLENREPNGVIPATDYEQVRSTLIDALRDVQTPGGDPVYEAVHPRETVFDGPYLKDAPDIVTVPNGFNHFLVSTLKGNKFDEPTEPWEHKREGLVMAYGEGVSLTADLSDAHLFDITPTILRSFGLPVGERMDGHPLGFIDSGDRTAYPEFHPAETTASDARTVEERLADLGYME